MSERVRSAGPTSTPERRRGGLLVPISLGVLTVVLALVGALLLVRADHLRTTGPVSNAAVVDSGATGQVISQVSTALNQVLSYDYRKPRVSKQAAQRWLTGDAPKQYQTLFDQLQKLAHGQKLTMVAKVVSAGVSTLRGDHAQLLVFIDQRSTRASDQQSGVTAAQVQIAATKQGKTWRISELKPL